LTLPGSRQRLTADTSIDTLDESNVVTISSNTNKQDYRK